MISRRCAPPVGAMMAVLVVVDLTLPSTPALAATLEVTRTDDPAPDGCRRNDCSLREAVIAANNRPGTDVIQLKARRYELTLAGANEDDAQTGDLDIHKNVTILGAGPRDTTIDANRIDRVFEIGYSGAPEEDVPTDVIMKDLSVRGGKDDATSTNGGGGILTFGGLALRRVRVVGNRAPNCCGGGILNSGGELLIGQSHFAGNRSGQCCGGAIDARNDAETTIRNSSFANNKTLHCCGGGIYNDQSLLVIKDSTFTGHSATSSEGGTIHSDTGTVRISDSEITNSSVLAGDPNPGIKGGAISSRLGTLRISRSLIADSEAAGGYGGGISSEDGTLIVVGSTIRGNTTAGYGGGLYSEDGSITVRNSRVLSNQAIGGPGAGAQIASGGEIINTLFRGNEQIGDTGSDAGGGGLSLAMVTGTTLEVTGSTFANNTAERYGGGIWFEGAGGLTVLNSTISGNTSNAIGGGFAEHDTGPVELLYSTFAFNESSGPGNGIGSDTSDISVEGLIVSNHAQDCNGPLSDTTGVNLDTDGECFTDPEDINGGARLRPLDNYGGRTPTHALKATSAALDAAPTSECPPPARDQRGVTRPKNGDGEPGSRCDLGSFEREP